MTPRERLARLAEAWLLFEDSSASLDALLDTVAKTVSIFPVVDCKACGRAFIRSDGRRRAGFCSDRCRYRISKREQRRQQDSQPAEPVE